MSGEHCILLVEDDRDIRETVREELELHGYRVVTSSNGQDALELLREIEPPSLIILDLMMPVMGGEEFLDELRRVEELAAIPVVLFSAWPTADAKMKSRVQAFLAKPITSNALLATVVQFCR